MVSSRFSPLMRAGPLAGPYSDCCRRPFSSARHPNRRTPSRVRPQRGGSVLIAWFKDPAGNVLSVIGADRPWERSRGITSGDAPPSTQIAPQGGGRGPGTGRHDSEGLSDTRPALGKADPAHQGGQLPRDGGHRRGCAEGLPLPGLPAGDPGRHCASGRLAGRGSVVAAVRGGQPASLAQFLLAPPVHPRRPRTVELRAVRQRGTVRAPRCRRRRRG